MKAKIIREVIHAPHLSAGAPRPTAEGNVGWSTKGLRLLRALHRWQKAGRPRTPRPLRLAREAACAVCDFFDPRGNWGFGQCRAPGCGCTKFKSWLLTETCPHPRGSRWPAPNELQTLQ